jgi:hypothetical protein
MKRRIVFASIVFFWNLGGVRNIAAQDLLITNARIIVGNGTVIDSGSIVIRSDRFRSAVNRYHARSPRRRDQRPTDGTERRAGERPDA